jgi:hypothetical protein
MLLLFTACVPCKHPLSDDKSSKVDERLIGEWRFFHDDKPDPVSGSIFVGRVKGSESTLEAVQCDVDKEGHVVVERVPQYTTKVGSLFLISIARQEVMKDRETVYDVALYEMPDQDTVNYYVMNDQVFGAAIDKKSLPGTVNSQTIFDKTRYADVKVTASPEDLWKFIEKTGKKCFLTEHGVTMKRVAAKQ